MLPPTSNPSGRHPDGRLNGIDQEQACLGLEAPDLSLDVEVGADTDLDGTAPW